MRADLPEAIRQAQRATASRMPPHMAGKGEKRFAKHLEKLLHVLDDAFPDLTTSDEPISGVSSAVGREGPGVKLSGLRDDPGVLVITDRFAYFAGVNHLVTFRLDRKEIHDVRWEGAGRGVGSLRFKARSDDVHLWAVGKEAAELLTSTEAGLPPPAGEPIAQFGRLVLYPDRLVTPEKVFPLTAEVRAEVQSAGSFAATRGRNIAAGAAGTVLLGPVGMLFGAAKTKVQDLRELYLLIDGADWAYGVNVSPSLGLELRQFAQQITVAARTLALRASQQPLRDQRLEQLAKLGDLRSAGILTDAEFDAEKARILSEG